jgi:hypothetical protein
VRPQAQVSNHAGGEFIVVRSDLPGCPEYKVSGQRSVQCRDKSGLK